MYCLCSNKSFEEIIEQQRENPLPFLQLVEIYTSCNKGCGTCIIRLYEKLSTLGLLIESDVTIKDV